MADKYFSTVRYFRFTEQNHIFCPGRYTDFIESQRKTTNQQGLQSAICKFLITEQT
ncbi:hypothetical protein KPSA3_03928 [Pseudomonas syringae pv. actinidiae]|uniref:Uncharacterized protein n=1 Tax=Pseudomonas syringae pv. actinidiae TaxID=103796 RepID=A0AAN4Q6B3_PSESF|nr:hypothetical protein KPSA3_03928 [Pseudomonas syringae pv. actinidiae]